MFQGRVGFLPHADEDVSVPENEQQYVVLRDVVEVGVLLVGEEEVGFPQTLEHVGVDGQRLALKVGRQAEARVVPSLTEENVHSVVLQRHTGRA